MRARVPEASHASFEWATARMNCTPAGRKRSIPEKRAVWNISARAMASALRRGNLFLPAAHGWAKFFRTFSVREFFHRGKKFSFLAYPEAMRDSLLLRFRRGYSKRTKSMECRILRAGG